MNQLLAFVIAIFALGTWSCSTSLKGTMEDSDGGTISLNISLSPAFQAYWADLRTADPTLPLAPLTEKALALSFKELEGIKSWSLETLKPGSYKLQIKFDHGQALMKKISGKDQPILNWTTSGTEKHLTFNLSQNTLQSLIQTTGLADSSALEVFLAGGEGEMTRDEYIELLSYFMESYDPKAKAIVAASTLDVTLDFPRPILKIIGGKAQGKSASFKTSLVDLLLLEKPLNWEVIY